MTAHTFTAHPLVQRFVHPIVKRMLEIDEEADEGNMMVLASVAYFLGMERAVFYFDEELDDVDQDDEELRKSITNEAIRLRKMAKVERQKFDPFFNQDESVKDLDGEP